MTDPIKLRLGDRTVWIVRPNDLESWPRELAEPLLREAASEWPARASLLQLSDDLLGPDHDLEPALAYLADALDRGSLLAVRISDDTAGLFATGTAADDWDDAPRLSDLGTDPPGGRKDDPARHDPNRPRPARPDPHVPGRGGDPDVFDPAATFVAFAVFDQHGKPLGGSSDCSVDAKRHAHALDGTTIEIRPIGPHARIELALAELSATSAG